MSTMTYPEFLSVVAALQPFDYLPVHTGPGQFPSQKPIWRNREHAAQHRLFEAAVAGKGDTAHAQVVEEFGDNPAWQRIVDAAEFWRSQPQWSIPDGVFEPNAWIPEDQQ